MTYALTPERLQDIAVRCVTGFITKQASMSESIAKEAQTLELNLDQTKRVVENCNTLAYLRQLEKAADRTFEFPLADISDVMKFMCVPEDMAKTAADDCECEDDKKSKDKDDKEKAKDDNSDDKEKDEDRDMPDGEKRAYLIRELGAAKSQLKDIAMDKIAMCDSLMKASLVLSKDQYAIEKLAMVVPSEELDGTYRLCSLEKRATENLVFRDAELNSARKVYDLYKQANVLLAKEAELTSFVNKAQDYFSKEASIFGSVIEGAGSLLGRAVGTATKAVVGGTAKAGLKAGVTLGKGIATGVGNTVDRAAGFVTNKMGITKGESVGIRTGFAGAAQKAGFDDVSKGVDAFDKIKAKDGMAAAKEAFSGKKPAFFPHRVGLGSIGTAVGSVAIGAGVTHKNNVNDL